MKNHVMFWHKFLNVCLSLFWHKFLNVCIILLVIVAAFGLMAAAPLQGETPPPPDSGEVAPTPTAPISDTSPEALAFIGYVVVITAFFQKRLNLQGYALMAAGAIVGAIIWFAPQFGDAIPAAKAWIDSSVVFVKLLLSAFGSVDFLSTAGARISTAKVVDGRVVLASTVKETK